MQNINTVNPEFRGTNFQPDTMAVAEHVNAPNSVIASDLTKLQDSLNECVQIINSPTIQEIDATIQAIQTRIGDVEDIIEGDVYAPKNHSSSSTDYGLQTEANYGHVKTIDNLTTTDADAGKQLSARQGSIIKGLINGLQNEIDGHQNDINGLHDEVDGIQTDINGIHGDIDGLHDDIDELQDDINSNTEEGNVIKGLINGLNSEVGGLQNQINSSNADNTKDALNALPVVSTIVSSDKIPKMSENGTLEHVSYESLLNTITTEIPSGTSVQHGAEADIPTTPKAGDQYMATDTGKVYFCFTQGVWVGQTIPSKNTYEKVIFAGRCATSTETHTVTIPEDGFLSYISGVNGDTGTVDIQVSRGGVVLTTLSIYMSAAKMLNIPVSKGEQIVISQSSGTSGRNRMITLQMTVGA